MPLTIAQISDIHCGSPLLHDRELLELAVEEILDLAPDVVVVAGDLTQEGYPDEFQAARDALRPLLEALTTIVIPGNHDAKNVGYVHFEDLFGKGEDGRADRVLHLRREAHPERVAIVAVDSSMPDLAEGEVGRERYSWIRGAVRCRVAVSNPRGSASPPRVGPRHRAGAKHRLGMRAISWKSSKIATWTW